ncbi:MAG: hypothetical protein DRI90_13200 [Deltaproteobacteria bacterium]|nr:MAG: hypothetical protein DRI90_13200 [Deltaproteobacteria bacterium]
MQQHNGWGLVAASVLTVSCAMPKTPVYKPDKGIGTEFCTKLADHSQLVSTQEMGIGVFLLTVGGASITASGVLATISANADNHRELLGYVGAGLAVAPLIGVPFGMVLLSRSDEASALAAASNTAVALAVTDKDAYRDCVLAKAAWVGSRSDATALARQALEEEKEKEAKRKEELEDSEEKDDDGGEQSVAPEADEDEPAEDERTE